jgi:Zn finger protein HypA/HybF involved in hydrogenase expression
MRKMSKAESGALGIAKSKATIQARKQERIREYNQNPNTCKYCSAQLSYENRKKTFCNHACSATYNNSIRSNLVKWHCQGCGKEHTNSANLVKKYCNNACQQLKTKQESFEKLKEGLITDRGMMRSILKREFGHKCFECGISEWRGHPIPLEIDHIDGDAGNNKYENIRMICPNCHGITPTWKGRNRGNGRAARGLSLS